MSQSETSSGAKQAKSNSQDFADAALEYAKQKKRKSRSSSTEQASKETSMSKKFADIKTNPFYAIVVASEASPTEKKEAVAKELAYDESKSAAENDAKLAAFESFKEYLMAYRKEMSKEIIRLQDTEAFSELQSVFEEMNTALLDFEERIGPLVEIIDAVHRLNIASDGAMYDVFKEIQADKAEEERVAALRADQQTQLDQFQAQQADFDKKIAELSLETSWWTKDITRSAKQKIAAIEVDKKNLDQQIHAVKDEMANTVAKKETKFGDLAFEKSKLRELLDLTSDEHKGRQQALVDAALTFVNSTEERSGSVLVHMVDMKDRIKNVDTVNGNMKRIFAIVNDGIKDAEDINETLTDKFNQSGEGESSIDRFEREDKLQGINEHVESLNRSKLDSLETLGELQEESMNIKSMRDTNSSQINHTRKMHSRGTAGVASRLSTVLTAVSSAALNEARIATQNTLESMNTMTQGTAQSEAIKNATRMHMENDQLTKSIEQLATYREVSDKATEISRAALEEQKILQREMELTAEELAQSIKRAKSVTSNVLQDGTVVDDQEEKQVAREPEDSPFDALSL